MILYIFKHTSVNYNLKENLALHVILYHKQIYSILFRAICIANCSLLHIGSNRIHLVCSARVFAGVKLCYLVDEQAIRQDAKFRSVCCQNEIQKREKENKHDERVSRENRKKERKKNHRKTRRKSRKMKMEIRVGKRDKTRLINMALLTLRINGLSIEMPGDIWLWFPFHLTQYGSILSLLHRLYGFLLRKRDFLCVHVCVLFENRV